MKRALPLLIPILVVWLAAPRGAQVIPSEPWGAVETDPALRGAPQTDIRSPLPQPSVSPVHSVSGGGAPPSAAIDGSGAAYFKPHPPRTVSVTGIGGEATWWYSFGPGLYAAIRPDLGSKGDLAVVCGGEPFHCLTLPIITSCACLGPGSGRLIDLSRDAFASFADPSVGVVRIVLQVVGQ